MGRVSGGLAEIGFVNLLDFDCFKCVSIESFEFLYLFYENDCL